MIFAFKIALIALCLSFGAAMFWGAFRARRDRSAVAVFGYLGFVGLAYGAGLSVLSVGVG